jgi:hypothetical protein
VELWTVLPVALSAGKPLISRSFVIGVPGIVAVWIQSETSERGLAPHPRVICVRSCPYGSKSCVGDESFARISDGSRPSPSSLRGRYLEPGRYDPTVFGYLNTAIQAGSQCPRLRMAPSSQCAIRPFRDQYKLSFGHLVTPLVSPELSESRALALDTYPRNRENRRSIWELPRKTIEIYESWCYSL